jgi:hypothetical protein
VFPSNLFPLAYTNAQGGTVFSKVSLSPLLAHPDWAEGNSWTLQVTASSTCPSSTLVFGFSYDGGTHIISVPPLAQGFTVTVVDVLNSRASDAFFQVD